MQEPRGNFHCKVRTTSIGTAFHLKIRTPNGNDACMYTTIRIIQVQHASTGR
jgi:hypothetical protein